VDEICGVSGIMGCMPKVQHTMSMDEKTIVKLAEEPTKIPRQRRRRKSDEPVDTSVKTLRKHSKEFDAIFQDVHTDVMTTAMELAEQNWRRLEKVDNQTVIVHNNEVH